jgi:hypothetical protein
MAYRLNRDEPVAAAARRVVREEVDAALAELGAGPLERDTRVHRARRHVKRARAALRLTRTGLGEQFSALDRRLRDAARLVATTRDSAVAVQAFDSVMTRFSAEAERPAFQMVRTGLVLRHRSLVLSNSTIDRLDGFRNELVLFAATVPAWSVAASGFAALESGLRSTYGSARETMDAAYRRPSAERFHDWRRHVRYHALHAALLSGVCGHVATARVKRAGRLAETLGIEHDLAVLGALLVERPARFGGPAAVFPLLDLIERRRAELRAAARPLGSRLFGARPSRVAERFARRWGAGAASVDARGASMRRVVAA